MYDGKAEYVFENGEMKKRAPVLETFAGTVYPVENHFEVIVPTVEQFEQLMSLTGGAEGMVAGSGYGPQEQKATIWHEAFHGYQLTNFAVLGEKVTPEDLHEEFVGNTGEKEKSEEQWIFAKCLILDRLDPNWKENFDFTKGLDEVIEEYGSQ